MKKPILDVVIRADGDGYVAWLKNDTYERGSGMSPDEALGNLIRNRSLGGDLPEIRLDSSDVPEQPVPARQVPAKSPKPELQSIEKPNYFDRLIGRHCRLICDVTGVPKAGDRTLGVPAGTLVRVVGGNYIAEPADFDDNFRMSVQVCKPSGREDKRYVSCDYIDESMLELDPGIPTWTREDSFAALQQGWDVFERDCRNNDGETFELCSWEHRRFKGDDEAAKFVWCWAVVEDSPLHQRALAFLRAVSPREYQRIRKLGRAAIAKGKDIYTR